MFPGTLCRANLQRRSATNSPLPTTNVEEAKKANFRKVYRRKKRRLILRNPAAGRPSVKPTLKLLAVERHRIFYRTIDDTVYIVRILHERMDTSRHL